jgi:hypothetical protein
VRQPGYALAEHPVELRPGASVDKPVLLVRPPKLEPIEMTAADADVEAFESSRRTNPYGQFLTQDQIDRKKQATETIDLFDDVLGFTALGHGPTARLVSNAALENHRDCSSASVFIQRGEGRRINDVTPGQVAGIEAYADASSVPGRFAGQADCGVIVIWLRTTTRPSARPAAGLRANGYP